MNRVVAFNHLIWVAVLASRLQWEEEGKFSSSSSSSLVMTSRKRIRIREMSCLRCDNDNERTNDPNVIQRIRCWLAFYIQSVGRSIDVGRSVTFRWKEERDSLFSSILFRRDAFVKRSKQNDKSIDTWVETNVCSIEDYFVNVMEMFSSSKSSIFLHLVILFGYFPSDLFAAPVQANMVSLYNSNDKLVILVAKNFSSTVYQSETAWLIEFYASWCGHCQTYANVRLRRDEIR